MAAEYDAQGFHQPRTKIKDNWKQIFFLLLFKNFDQNLFAKYEHICVHIGLDILFGDF